MVRSTVLLLLLPVLHFLGDAAPFGVFSAIALMCNCSDY